MLKQAGKSSARKDNVPALPSTAPAGGSGSSGTASLSSAPAAMAPADIASPSTFAKSFSVSFCGRVTVPHKNAPPALIDECIGKFNSGAEGDASDLRDGLKSLAVPPNGLSKDVHEATILKHPVSFKRDLSFLSLQAVDENRLSPEICQRSVYPAGVRPSSQQENRAMLFMVIFKILYTYTTVIDLELVYYISG